MDKYAVFGNPISQSKSPFIHQRFAQLTKQVMNYSAIKPEHDNFCLAIEQFKLAGGIGCNVTAPYKEQAFQLADHLSEEAKLAEAVNTLSFNEDGSISGDNTDGLGLVEDLKAKGAKLKGRILLIGAGGAARGVIKPLLANNPQCLVITNRTFAKAELLANKFMPYGSISARSAEKLKYENQFDLVINSTSASLTNELPPVPHKIFANKPMAYDMSYKKELTSFCQWAKDNGCQHIADGLGMLVGQAAVAFEIWRGIMPETEPVLSALREELGK